MKQILAVLLLCVCMPSVSMTRPFEMVVETEHRLESIIYLEVSHYVQEKVGREKRSPIFIPISASHDTENLYLCSRISIDDATIVVKDEWKNVLYEVSTSMLSGEEIVLPLSIEKGSYTLEIMYGSICLSGDFEI